MPSILIHISGYQIKSCIFWLKSSNSLKDFEMAFKFAVSLLAFCAIIAVALARGHRRHNSQNGNDAFNCAALPPSLWCACEKSQAKCGTGQLCGRYNDAVRHEPLHITLLYESLCPDCQKFLTETLFNFYLKFKQYVRIELVPFGNAEVLQNGTIECQHGPRECQINKFQSCAIYYMHEPLPYIYCLESLIGSGVSLDKAAKKCYAKLHPIPHIYDQIIHCFNGPKGDRLQKEAAQRTSSAWPDQHEYVPWILVNNASLQNTQFLMQGLPTLLCLSRVGIDQDPIPACDNTLGGSARFED